MIHNAEYIYLFFMSVFFLIGLTVVYAFLLLFFSYGIFKTKRTKRHSHKLPSLSVVLPIRNEEVFLDRTLKSLEDQDFEGTWEVICVNDRSTDSTPQILESFCKTHPLFRFISLPQDLPPVASPKKRALEAGFKEAQYDVLLIMDADCEPPKTLLSSMASCFRDGVQIVQGPKKNNGNSSIIHTVQKMETLGFTAMEAAGFTLGSPMVASAASLAYKKDLFFKVGGFGDLMNLSSGDDDMLIHKMIKEEGVRFCYNLDPDAIMETAPVDTWKALFFQRARWASNGTQYTNPFYVLLLTLVYTFFVWLFISPWLVLWINIPLSWFIIPFLTKMAVDFLFLSIAAFKLKQLKLLWAFIHTEIIQVPMITFAVPFGQLGLFKWK
jgi:hypothetical protein